MKKKFTLIYSHKNLNAGENFFMSCSHALKQPVNEFSISKENITKEMKFFKNSKIDIFKIRFHV